MENNINPLDGLGFKIDLPKKRIDQKVGGKKDPTLAK